MTRKAAVLVALLVPLLASHDARDAAAVSASKSANFTYRMDYDSTTLTYCRLTGLNGSPWGTPMLGPARIKTTGSSVTVVAVTAGQLPFANVGVDDVLIVTKPNGSVDVRVVATKVDGDNITVQTAVNWDQTTGFTFRWFDTQCGTTDADGWIDASGLNAKGVVFQLEQISGVTGGLDMRVECRGQGLGSLPNPVHPGASASASCSPGTLASAFCNFTTAGVTTGRLEIVLAQDIVCPQIRVGVKIGTSETAETVEGDKERVTITFESEAQP